MHLENWLHKRIIERSEKDVAYIGPRALDRSTIESYQLSRLRQTIRYAFENSAYYRRAFHENGMNPDGMRNLNDLTELPFTEPNELAESPYRFLCLSQAEVAHVCTFVTSGTTGPQKKLFWTQDDLDQITDFMTAGIGVVAKPSDSVLIILPDGRPNSQADLLFKGVAKLGAKPVLSAFDATPEEHLQMIQQFRPTVIFGYTGRIFRMSKELQPKLDLRSLDVKVLFLASEYLPDAMRRELENIWNCKVHTHYGLTEMGLGVAVECEARNGYHFNEADLLLEIVDPLTGKAVNPGVEGELVFTTLCREAMPLIRYRTHDISRIITEPCPCGSKSLLKFGAVRKRLESVLHTENGDELYPALLDDLLFEIPGLIDYQAILERYENKEILRFKIELGLPQAHSLSEIVHKLASAPIIARGLSCGTMLNPEVELVGPGRLRSQNRAKKLIADCRFR
jgi:phenylacetate-coenzyme A ligase PaaK-like adenylate-forming protein